MPGLLCMSSLALADVDADRARQLREAGDILPLETILEKIQAAYPGKVLEVELEEKHKKLVYEIELLDDKGKVWKLLVDPRTAEVLKQKQDE